MRLKIARGVVETCRLLPVMVTFGIGLGVLFALEALVGAVGFCCPARSRRRLTAAPLSTALQQQDHDLRLEY
ncbi:hypothetical protein ABT116_37050 [Streptomyces sp. NPDC002130]|uniref:hypothetical protein n=1 Tax=Streptomyces sp. NPDC002130 TaxID=3155568 RepID=UPI00331D5F93